MMESLVLSIKILLEIIDLIATYNYLPFSLDLWCDLEPAVRIDDYILYGRNI
ncbi:MAG TPA: hypothetical protein VIS49_14660 [Cyclobacteriaceae bacterium]